MPSKFDTFETALRALCRKHQFVIGPMDRGGRIGVWNVLDDSEPIRDLEERTGAVAAGPKRTDLKPYFLTILTSKEFRGYLGHGLVRSMADALAVEHIGAYVIPIAPPIHVRGSHTCAVHA